ncbi:DinB family protein [Schlesneria paludicola]|uniref:DinB family protein n=1 Tax=Schlesneria paludicola TaxID=360056 RepID=UPI00029AD840|nr:DinB family protein [Schlesneria paludicola]
MFENEIALNQALIRQFKKTVADIPEDVFFHPCVGHGHPPIWIIGHLAIIAEMSQQMIGGAISHPDWLPLFGRNSSDIVSPEVGLTKATMVATLVENYQRLRDLAGQVDESAVARPHNIELFQGTTITTVGHCVTLVLTSHFGFHLGQLSSCRRTAGFGPLF